MIEVPHAHCGLKNNLISWCQEYFSEKGDELRIALDLKKVDNILAKETFHLLVFDIDHLRSIGQNSWLLNAYTGPAAPCARNFSPTLPEGSPTSRRERTGSV